VGGIGRKITSMAGLGKKISKVKKLGDVAPVYLPTSANP
jgi:hypothetical protein